MQRKSFEGMQCPLARSLEQVGERWNMLILRDAFYGMTRFDEFQNSLGIAPNILSRRLADLVKAGLLERRPYNTKPARFEYVLTERGRDFRPVMLSLMAWGNRHLAPEGLSILPVDEQSGQVVEPALVDLRTGEPITRERHLLQAGPAASDRTRARIELRNRRRTQDRHSTLSVSPSPESSS